MNELHSYPDFVVDSGDFDRFESRANMSRFGWHLRLIYGHGG